MKSQLKNGQFQLKKSDVERLLSFSNSMRDRLIIELLYFCGLRRSEVVAIQPADMDFTNKTLRVRGKGGKERLVPVPERVLLELKLFCSNSTRPYVFSAVRKRRAPLVPIMVNRACEIAGKRAGIKNPNPKMKNINPHLLRHSMARRLKNKGVPLEAISSFLGHEKLSMTIDTYGLMSSDDILSSVRRVVA